MNGGIFGRKGVTIMELLIAVSVALFVLGTTLSIWTFFHKVWTAERYRSALRVDMMKGLETIRRDIRLSSGTYMLFYPTGGAVFTAISMPLAEADDDGLYSLDGENKIAWDKTVIYHVIVEAGVGKKLRRTVINSWNSGWGRQERYGQLANVASGTLAGDSYKDLIRTDLESFEISSSSPITDFYDESADAVCKKNVTFGHVQLGLGSHDIRFTVAGKNTSSSGYAFGIDNLKITPSGSVREAEYYISTFALPGMFNSNGFTASRVYGDKWGNGNYLEYAAMGSGDWIEITDGYDLWRNSSFEVASRDNVSLTGEEERVALDLPNAFDLPGYATDPEEVAWHAQQQTGANEIDGYANPSNPAGEADDPMVIRTLIKSQYLVLNREKDLIRIRFMTSSSAGSSLRIEKAYITRKNNAVGAENYDGLENDNPIPGEDAKEYHMHQQLFFRDTIEDFDGDGVTDDIVSGITILPSLPQGGEAWSEWTAFPLITADSVGNAVDYLVTYLVTVPAGGACKYWPGSSVNTYYLTGAGYDLADLEKAVGTPAWQGVYTPEGSTDEIFAVAEIDSWRKVGTVESQIFNTALDNPAYNTIRWSEYSPVGTAASVKARASDDENMSGAAEWETLSSGSPPAVAGRYVQSMAELSTVPYWEISGGGGKKSYEDYVNEQVSLASYEFPLYSGEFLVSGVTSVWVDDIEVDWPGKDRVCTISGDIAKRNDYGQVTVTVDGRELIKTLIVDMKASVDFFGRILQEENRLEIEPRNTSK